MKNNIKKAPVKFREDGLYFQHYMLILSQISDNHHQHCFLVVKELKPCPEVFMQVLLLRVVVRVFLNAKITDLKYL